MLNFRVMPLSLSVFHQGLAAWRSWALVTFVLYVTLSRCGCWAIVHHFQPLFCSPLGFDLVKNKSNGYSVNTAFSCFTWSSAVHHLLSSILTATAWLLYVNAHLVPVHPEGLDWTDLFHDLNKFCLWSCFSIHIIPLHPSFLSLSPPSA